MYYSIAYLCPNLDQSCGGYGFNIRLYPKFKELVKLNDDLNQDSVNKLIKNEGRQWLDACGYDVIYDPDNPYDGLSFEQENKPLGPNAHPLYKPGLDLRVSWGEWGPEHITVPGNACGLDLYQEIGSPKYGNTLVPHNVDNWKQVQLILVTFTWFADYMLMKYDQEQFKAKDE